MSATLDRRQAVPELIPRPEDYLIVSGLAGAAKDTAALTEDADFLFTMAGAMGGACSIGLGLALARPERRVLVVTGDGELLMNLGALATIGAMAPPNLKILCIDTGRYGETGNQETHTARTMRLDLAAAAAGFRTVLLVDAPSALATGARTLREENGPIFLLLKVGEGPPAPGKRDFDPAACRLRFRGALAERP